MAENNDVVKRFELLAERYEHLHRPGAWYDLKNELGLGSGPFHDRLSIAELERLNEELTERLASCHRGQ